MLPSTERKLDRLVAHIRVHVAEMRRLERAGGDARDLAERRALIARLQAHLAEAVRAAVAPPRRTVT